jgi:hypothetical protein
MKYFNSLPKAVYTKSGVSTYYTNLMARASVVPSILNKSLVYYEYDLQDQDTPEIVAHKYYGDINRFWIVLYCNQMNDPLWDWPLSSTKFEKYVANKYPGTLDDIHHYEIIKTKTILNSMNPPDVERLVCSQEEYDSIILNETKTVQIGAETVVIQTSRKAITNYEYELEENESKRKIKILNKEYAGQLEREFVSLMKN